MKASNFSVLNYCGGVFSKIAPRCTKVGLKEIEDGFESVDSLSDFSENLLTNSLKINGKSNVHIHCFIDGILMELDDTNFSQKWNSNSASFDEKIATFNTSLRVTNIQNVDTIIQYICSNLSHRFQIPMTCNMYISPNKEFNCLGKHADIQETFIFQLFGRKRWMIFQDDNGEDLRLYYDDVQCSPCTSYRILNLDQGEILYTPSNLVHKVECDGYGPSVHLNFALNLKDKMDFCNYYFDVLKKKIAEDYNFNEPIDRQFLDSLCNNIQAIVSSLNNARIREEYEQRQFIESLSLLKRGRVYLS